MAPDSGTWKRLLSDRMAVSHLTFYECYFYDADTAFSVVTALKMGGAEYSVTDYDLS